MKLKSKPIARADLRERMEKKFRARGSLAFHLLLILGVGILLLYNLPQLWASRLGFGFPNVIDLIVLFGILSTSGALHFIRYYYRHGRGRDRHEAETAARIFRQLQLTNAEDAEEQEELIRLQMEDRLRNKRLAWQHLAVFVGIASIFFAGHAGNMSPGRLLDWAIWRDVVTLFGMWGIGLAAHALRYVFTWRYSADGREREIDAQVAQELERESRRSQRGAARAAAESDEAVLEPALTLDDLEVVQGQARS